MFYGKFLRKQKITAILMGGKRKGSVPIQPASGSVLIVAFIIRGSVILLSITGQK